MENHSDPFLSRPLLIDRTDKGDKLEIRKLQSKDSDTHVTPEQQPDEKQVNLTLHISDEEPLELFFSLDDPMILHIFQSFMNAGTGSGAPEIIHFNILTAGQPADLYVRASSINAIKATPSLVLDFENMSVKKKRRYALVVLSLPVDSERSKEMLPITLESIKSWCDRHDVDFIHRTDTGEWMMPGRPHCERLKLGPYLDQYDRFIYMDDSCIVSPDCPNIFDLVPEGKLGCVVERHQNPEKKLKEALARYGVSYSNNQYFNAGVLVFSQVHRLLFQDINELIREPLWDQDYFNAMVNKYQLPIEDLGAAFNFLGSRIPNRMKNPAAGEKVYVWHLTKGCRNRFEYGRRINQLLAERVL